jgi:RNA polymerase sigma-70 factor (ECF subfamily)
VEQKEMNTEILEALYRQYAKLILKVSFEICRDKETAENITNDVFLALIEHLEDIKPEKYKSWLVKTAKNKTLNQMEKASREVLTDDFEVVVDATDSSASAEDMVMDSLEKKVHKERERKMLAKLREKNERWYRIFTMAHYDKISQVKIAEMLNMSVGSVYTGMNRAKTWLKKNYNQVE